MRQVEWKEEAYDPLQLRARRRARRSVILSGEPVRTEHVLLLAGMLDGDELAAKLERGIANNNSIVGLTFADRHRIMDALATEAPSGLAELRNVLRKQLKHHQDRETQERRIRLHHERVRRRHERHG